ncbi:hypothetical protein CBR_g17607 [Chara braunii]|uniref:Ubiquitin-like protease family profile domain-containing protein n=1 Tax=Chara braunii TaxID=69332 RepID=A0A388KV83_CHABU|nr:hypothetical protein CBR_g17607 [Chara braunii]|eukprot:GBG73892.1 hypothetical protein CBR_g17607 [Chara braunii]
MKSKTTADDPATIQIRWETKTGNKRNNACDCECDGKPNRVGSEPRVVSSTSSVEVSVIADGRAFGLGAENGDGVMRNVYPTTMYNQITWEEEEIDQALQPVHGGRAKGKQKRREREAEGQGARPVSDAKRGVGAAKVEGLRGVVLNVRKDRESSPPIGSRAQKGYISMVSTKLGRFRKIFCRAYDDPAGPEERKSRLQAVRHVKEIEPLGSCSPDSVALGVRDIGRRPAAASSGGSGGNVRRCREGRPLKDKIFVDESEGAEECGEMFVGWGTGPPGGPSKRPRSEEAVDCATLRESEALKGLTGAESVKSCYEACCSGDTGTQPAVKVVKEGFARAGGDCIVVLSDDDDASESAQPTAAANEEEKCAAELKKMLQLGSCVSKLAWNGSTERRGDNAADLRERRTRVASEAEAEEGQPASNRHEQDQTSSKGEHLCRMGGMEAKYGDGGQEELCEADTLRLVVRSECISSGTTSAQRGPEYSSTITAWSNYDNDDDETAVAKNRQDSEAASHFVVDDNQGDDAASGCGMESSSPPGVSWPRIRPLIFPPNGRDAVRITDDDLNLLKPMSFINDTLVDFYMKYLEQQFLGDEKEDRFYIFNSFFFRKLRDSKKASTTCCCDGGQLLAEALADPLRKWTRRVNLFDYSYLVIPINESAHWSVVIICHPGDVVKQPTRGDDIRSVTPCILHLDSLSGSHTNVDLPIRRYLLDEHVVRFRSDQPVHSMYQAARSSFFDSKSFPMYKPKVPQQGNFTDCGLFVIHYVELFCQQAPLSFNWLSVGRERPGMLCDDWFDPAEASAKRRVLSALILQKATLVSSPGEEGRQEREKSQGDPCGLHAEHFYSAAAAAAAASSIGVMLREGAPKTVEGSLEGNLEEGRDPQECTVVNGQPVVSMMEDLAMLTPDGVEKAGGAKEERSGLLEEVTPDADVFGVPHITKSQPESDADAQLSEPAITLSMSICKVSVAEEEEPTTTRGGEIDEVVPDSQPEGGKVQQRSSFNAGLFDKEDFAAVLWSEQEQGKPMTTAEGGGDAGCMESTPGSMESTPGSSTFTETADFGVFSEEGKPMRSADKGRHSGWMERTPGSSTLTETSDFVVVSSNAKPSEQQIEDSGRAADAVPWLDISTSPSPWRSATPVAAVVKTYSRRRLSLRKNREEKSSGPSRLDSSPSYAAAANVHEKPELCYAVKDDDPSQQLPSPISGKGAFVVPNAIPSTCPGTPTKSIRVNTNNYSRLRDMDIDDVEDCHASEPNCTTLPRSRRGATWKPYTSPIYVSDSGDDSEPPRWRPLLGSNEGDATLNRGLERNESSDVCCRGFEERGAMCRDSDGPRRPRWTSLARGGRHAMLSRGLELDESSNICFLRGFQERGGAGDDYNSIQVVPGAERKETVSRASCSTHRGTGFGPVGTQPDDVNGKGGEGDSDGSGDVLSQLSRLQLQSGENPLSSCGDGREGTSFSEYYNYAAAAVAGQGCDSAERVGFPARMGEHEEEEHCEVFGEKKAVLVWRMVQDHPDSVKKGRSDHITCRRMDDDSTRCDFSNPSLEDGPRSPRSPACTAEGDEGSMALGGSDTDRGSLRLLENEPEVEFVEARMRAAASDSTVWICLQESDEDSGGEAVGLPSSSPSDCHTESKRQMEEGKRICTRRIKNNKGPQWPEMRMARNTRRLNSARQRAKDH